MPYYEQMTCPGRQSGGRKTATGCLVAAILLTLSMMHTAQPTVVSAQPASDVDTSFPAEAIDFFERRVRPILTEHCVSCHGKKKQESGLRLDRRASILQGGDSGPAALPGLPERSLLIAAVRGSNDLAMPPDDSLKSGQIDALITWIQLGLPWPPEDSVTHSPDSRAESHWAFHPVQRPAIPEVTRHSWPKNEIDRFILSKLEQARLEPAPPASRHALIRRATLDLTGLPPTPDELKQFESFDDQHGFDAAYQSLIDRLLDSPHYGERQARHWLDVARYADNKGYVFFEEKDYPWAWTYRDWVIDAFNRDLPYDQFLKQQLAADLLNTKVDRSSLAAMGFLTLGARFMNNTHDIIDDRIDVVMRGLQGLTVTCARCHDHKFDPIPQDDYYSLYGIFRSSYEPTLRPLFQAIPDSDEFREFDKGMRERVEKLKQFEDGQRHQIMKAARDRVNEYLLAVHRKRNHPSTENFMLLADKGGLIPAVVHRWEVWLKRARRSGDPVWTLWHRLSDLPEETFADAAREIIDAVQQSPDLAQNNAEGERLQFPVNRLVREAFAGSTPESMKDVADVYGSLFRKTVSEMTGAEKDGHQIGDQKKQQSVSDPDTQAVRQVLFGPDSPPMIPEQLGWGFLDLIPDRPTQAEFKKLIGEVEKWSRTGPGAPPRAMVLMDSEIPFEPVVFQRGNPHREGKRVPRRMPQVISGSDRSSFTRGSGRLELANAIVSPKNPLTARVFVNRIWKQHFGTGLVDTASDFGLRSSPPSHPHLLDWLASEFINANWSMKKLHRLIVTSAVYQQSTEPPPDSLTAAHQSDVSNRLLWKFPRRRLDFEATRDSLLAAAGALDGKIGGPPQQVLDGFVPRRTVYGFVNRMDLPGLMRSFDFPEPAATSPGRETTTIAPQALFFLNNDFVTECARRLLQRNEFRALTESAPTSHKVQIIYRILFARNPTPAELNLAEAFLDASAEPDVPAASKAWSYGYGSVDGETSRVNDFQRLTHWTGKRWQGGPKLPDAKLGWLFHDRNGGHPASSDDRCAIRRWTSPLSGSITIESHLKHRPEPGNGVRGRIVSSRSGILGEARVDHSESDINVSSIPVEPGDTVDFVADWQGHITHDEHEWQITIKRADPVSQSHNESVVDWNAQRDFTGSAPDRWIDYVHALLMSNEFVFTD